MSDNHTHPHEHEHDHAHEHTHDGCIHGEQKAQSAEENVALLKYMLEHNRHHGEDLHELYHSLEEAGKADAAKLVSDALHFFDHGNEKLAEALKLL